MNFSSNDTFNQQRFHPKKITCGAINFVRVSVKASHTCSGVFHFLSLRTCAVVASQSTRLATTVLRAPHVRLRPMFDFGQFDFGQFDFGHTNRTNGNRPCRLGVSLSFAIIVLLKTCVCPHSVHMRAPSPRDSRLWLLSQRAPIHTHSS